MKRTIIAYGNYYNEFVNTLNEKEKLKFKYILSLMEKSDRMPVRFIKYIRDGLHELRMEYESKIYRMFLFSIKIVLLFFSMGSKRKHKRHLKMKLKKH